MSFFITYGSKMARPLHFQTRICFLLIFLLSPFVCSAPLSTEKKQCLSDQKSVLMQIKWDIHEGFNVKMKEWNLEKDCCSWEGVTCDSAGHVVGLDLSDEYLLGNSSAKFYHSLSQLHFLSMLNLDGNDLSCMPLNFLSNLSNLNSLSLNNCELHGNFPESIFLLPKIRSIDLGDNPFLTGQLLEFSFNSSLEFLYLFNTSFYGRIPNSIINLKYLKYFSLSNCNFSGMIPSSLSNLSQITFLNLADNKFSGSIPPFHYNGVPELVYLRLSSNHLSGVIHSSLFTLPSLLHLFLDNNEFVGQLEKFPNASSSGLMVLDLSENDFEGSMKLEMFQNLKSLLSLSLSNSGLSFRYDNSSCDFPHLQLLEMSNCDLTEFPNILKNQVPLLYLILSNNYIRGHLPNWIWKSSLRGLHLSNNEIDFQEPLLPESNASMPHFLINGNNSIPMLQYLVCRSCNITKFPNFLKFQEELLNLDLSDNNIDGKAPSWLWGMQRLQTLDISFNDLDAFDQTLPNVSSTSLMLLDFHANKLQGSFPITICNLSTLAFLDASQNRISGLIPECISKINALYVLNLNWNYFQCMPPNFTLMSMLHSLKINGNQLEGKLPRSLINCTKLEVLDLGNNKIHDTFPFWLEKLPVLKVLILKGNKFFGPIDHHNGQIVLPQLCIMDLSSNKFTGELSKEFFQGLKAMVKVNETKSQPTYIGQDYNNPLFYYRDSVEIIEKGVEMEVTRILTIFTSLDLSSNEFVGKIPKEIGCLESLVVLNLSGNGFSNKIPSSLGNLAKLESLDLSRNMLSGNIPLEFLRLTFLSVMNLSYNHLEGLIPQGNQFNTFSNDSYIGNANLCGAPLSKKCGEDGAKILPGKQSENPEGSISNWQIILMGYGCGVVIGFSIGFMLWPKMESLSLMMKFRERVHRKNQKRKSKHGRNLHERRSS